MFDSINLFFINVLQWIHGWVGNYGWSVVVFTLLIRLCVLPLDIKSRRGMYAMNRVQPKMQELQKKYADDKDKLNRKMMELYKKEHVSPTAGCLPLLLQWPILIFMFTAMRVFANEQTIQMLLNLKDGIEPTLQSWLWIKNVFQPDSFTASILPAIGDQLQTITAVGYSKVLTAENIEAARAFLASSDYAMKAATYGAEAFKQIQLNFLIIRPTLMLPTSIANLFQYANGLFILPILAGVSQFVMNSVMSGKQTKKPEAGDNPMNMNSGFMKWFFPLFSVWICASSNAAFSIYWMAVNVISIIQTVILNKYFERKDALREQAEKAQG